LNFHVELPKEDARVRLTAQQFRYRLPLYGLREKFAVAYAGWLGPRTSEAFDLKWGDLDLLSGVVSFRRAFIQGRVTPLKTQASRKDISLPKEGLELLHKRRSVAP
jgi:integrase